MDIQMEEYSTLLTESRRAFHLRAWSKRESSFLPDRPGQVSGATRQPRPGQTRLRPHCRASLELDALLRLTQCRDMHLPNPIVATSIPLLRLPVPPCNPR